MILKCVIIWIALGLINNLNAEYGKSDVNLLEKKTNEKSFSKGGTLNLQYADGVGAGSVKAGNIHGAAWKIRYKRAASNEIYEELTTTASSGNNVEYETVNASTVANVLVKPTVGSTNVQENITSQSNSSSVGGTTTPVSSNLEDVNDIKSPSDAVVNATVGTLRSTVNTVEDLRTTSLRTTSLSVNSLSTKTGDLTTENGQTDPGAESDTTTTTESVTVPLTHLAESSISETPTLSFETTSLASENDTSIRQVNESLTKNKLNGIVVSTTSTSEGTTIQSATHSPLSSSRLDSVIATTSSSLLSSSQGGENKSTISKVRSGPATAVLEETDDSSFLNTSPNPDSHVNTSDSQVTRNNFNDNTVTEGAGLISGNSQIDITTSSTFNLPTSIANTHDPFENITNYLLDETTTVFDLPTSVLESTAVTVLRANISSASTVLENKTVPFVTEVSSSIVAETDKLITEDNATIISLTTSKTADLRNESTTSGTVLNTSLKYIYTAVTSEPNTHTSAPDISNSTAVVSTTGFYSKPATYNESALTTTLKSQNLTVEQTTKAGLVESPEQLTKIALDPPGHWTSEEPLSLKTTSELSTTNTSSKPVTTETSKGPSTLTASSERLTTEIVPVPSGPVTSLEPLTPETGHPTSTSGTSSDPPTPATSPEPLFNETRTRPLTLETSPKLSTPEASPEPSTPETSSKPVTPVTSLKPLPPGTSSTLTTAIINPEPSTSETSQEHSTPGTSSEPLTTETSPQPSPSEISPKTSTPRTSRKPLTPVTSPEPTTHEISPEPYTFESSTEPLTTETSSAPSPTKISPEPSTLGTSAKPSSPVTKPEPSTPGTSPEPETSPEPLTPETSLEPSTETISEPLTTETIPEPLTTETIPEPVTTETIPEPLTTEAIPEPSTPESSPEPSTPEPESTPEPTPEPRPEPPVTDVTGKPEPNNETTAIPEIETTAEPEENSSAYPEPESELDTFAEPGPDWEVAKVEWKQVWEFHVYFFGALFVLLGLYCVVSVIRLWSMDHLLSRHYFLTLNVLVIFICAFRAIYLLVDAYNSNGLFPVIVDYCLYNTVFPCTTAVFSILFYALLLATRLRVLSPKVQKLWVLIVIIAFHFVFSFTTDIVVGLYSGASVLLFVCQVFFIIWGLFMFIGYLIIFKKLYTVAINRQKAIKASTKEKKLNGAMISFQEKVPKQRYTIGLAVKVTFVSAVFGLGIIGSELYGMFGVYGVMHSNKPEPWPWWAYHTVVRTLELLMCSCVAYVAAQPFKYTNKKRKKSCFTYYLPCKLICCQEKTKDKRDGEFSSHSLDHYVVSESEHRHWRKKNKHRNQSSPKVTYPPHTAEKYTDQNATLLLRKFKQSMLVVEDGFVRIKRQDEIIPMQYQPDCYSQTSDLSASGLSINLSSGAVSYAHSSRDSVNVGVGTDSDGVTNEGFSQEDIRQRANIDLHNCDQNRGIENINRTESVISDTNSSEVFRPLSSIDLAASMESELARAFHSSYVDELDLISHNSLPASLERQSSDSNEFLNEDLYDKYVQDQQDSDPFSYLESPSFSSDSADNQHHSSVKLLPSPIRRTKSVDAKAHVKIKLFEKNRYHSVSDIDSLSKEDSSGAIVKDLVDSFNESLI